MMKKISQQFVQWFRSASPYIHSHRGNTFVVYFGGEALQSEGFSGLVHDLALLSSLGIRLVVVYGARPQIEMRLQDRNLNAIYAKGLRVTDQYSLDCAKEAVGAIRVEIEALFSTGIINSPMAGAQVRVASGNYVTARPLGVREGIDYCYTGEVRRIDTQAISKRLDCNEIVLISPLGYSPSGEVFNLSSFDVASSVAVALGADKLVLLTEGDKAVDSDTGALVRQMSQEGVARRLEDEDGSISELLCASTASQNGVDRVHLINRDIEGGLLLELFTRDGVGTMLSAAPFDKILKASVDDIGGILELIVPLEESGVLVRRSREKLEIELEYFTVMKREHAVIACGALYPYIDDNVAEIACVAVDRAYMNQGRGEALLERFEAEAQASGISRLFVLTTQTTHWFLEQGFSEGDISELPMERRSLYNFQRNSKVYFKALS